MSGAGRFLVLLLTAPLPWPMKRRALGLLLGYDIDPAARIGLALVDAERVELGPQARVGHLTMIRGLERLVLEEGAVIGTLNRVTGPPPEGIVGEFPDRRMELTLGRWAWINSRHVIDCSDSVAIGDYTMVVGGDTQMLTHEVEIESGEHRCAPVRIGRNCLVHTRCLITAGSVLPDRTVVAGAALVNRPLEKGVALYGGVPARHIKDLDPDSGFFARGERIQQLRAIPGGQERRPRPPTGRRSESG